MNNKLGPGTDDGGDFHDKWAQRLGRFIIRGITGNIAHERIGLYESRQGFLSGGAIRPVCGVLVVRPPPSVISPDRPGNAIVIR